MDTTHTTATTAMTTATHTTTDRPASYHCTLCHKVHRLSQQGRGFGTDRYSMHYEWRIGGRHAYADSCAK